MERAEKEELVVEKSEDIINDIERLPEGCISDILSLTSPADVCRSSLVSTLFKSAADSDALWERFLPPDFQDIISRASNPISSADAPSKKELYSRLCNDPLLIDGGSKSFHLQKSSGKKCIMLGAKELAISWGDGKTPWYWDWPCYPGSRFAQVAELHGVWWLQIHGKLEIQLLSPDTFYVAHLVFKLRDDAYGFDDYEPIKAKVEVVGRADGDTSACSQERLIYLSACSEYYPPDPLEPEYFARERGDGWMEVEMGHFYNGGDNEGVEVHMSVLETERRVHKQGLIVQGMELRPKVGIISHSNPDPNEHSSSRSRSRRGRGTRGGRVVSSSFTYAQAFTSAASTSQPSTGSRGGRGSRGRRGGRSGRGLFQQT
ncbi:F-box protein PP2-B10-like [Papaver somniferum]|uniref:F-box protein PP2-B10-like n=1 Tax=Papaver somniferum TaxID=3469 RepID=UPI000E700AA8|nr:F-box protein PP2-B10-like [Papaver somniferum]XP_026438458.1 F-box protein PP2-B10-like [Papaver somniferum]XP_026438462.1 F-box protein PP2-B10-like [Papaver somniferum]XP_026438463.1 F-box protein PP2-B10-like [Papaver somniferum]